VDRASERSGCRSIISFVTFWWNLRPSAAETHTVILPHAAALQRQSRTAALDRVSHALGAHEAAGALFDLAATNGAPTSLRQIGCQRPTSIRATMRRSSPSYWNPRPIERDPIRALLDDAYHGRRPT